MKLLEALEWRYATKAMNGETIKDEDRKYILEAMRLAPTSLGAQPLKFYVVKDQQSKDLLAPAIFNQPQISRSDSVIIIASLQKFSEEWLQGVMDLYASERNMSDTERKTMYDTLYGYMSPYTPEMFAAWTARQAYIALGMGLAAAAELKIDSTPMEGFNQEELDKLLGLTDTEYSSVLVMPLGHRDPEHDWLAPQKKVRLPYDQIVEEKTVS